MNQQPRTEEQKLDKLLNLKTITQEQIRQEIQQQQPTPRQQAAQKVLNQMVKAGVFDKTEGGIY